MFGVGLCFLFLQIIIAGGFNCTFDTDICDWTQEQGDNFDWTRHGNGTTTMGTGPSVDHTTGDGFYMFIDTSFSRKEEQVALLTSPVINGSIRACVMFYYHMVGLNVSPLKVFYYRNGSPGRLAWTATMAQGNTWKKGLVQIEGGSATSRVTQVVFEAVRSASYQGTIAIDDVSLTSGTCPTEEFNCTFDIDSCGWTQELGDHFDWTRHVGGTRTSGTGPSFDHTSGNGYYMYIETSSPRSPGHTARLISPTVDLTEEMCLVFYYHMYGHHVDRLNVYFSRDGALGCPVWTKFQPQGNVWKRATVHIAGGSAMTGINNIVIEAVRGDNYQGDIAIDDISIHTGTCPPVLSGTLRLISSLNNGVGRLEVYHDGSWGTVCDTGFTDQSAEVTCRELGMIESWSKPTTASVPSGSGQNLLDDVRCTGNETSLSECEHSPWGSHNCSHSQHVGVNCDTEGINCTFDMDTCGWTQNRRNKFDWIRTAGGSGSSAMGTRPGSDHTSGSGSYLYINTSHTSAEEEIAELLGPTMNGTQRSCLTFYYHMFGLNVSSLKVLFYQVGSYSSPVFTKSKSQGNAWKKGMVQIEGGSATSRIIQVVFDAVRGAGYQGTIAVDDISLTLGNCPKETITVNLEPNLDIIKIAEGKGLNVKCVYLEAELDVTSITWSHNGRNSFGSTFQIQKVTQSDEGRLACMAHGSEGTSPGRADAFIVVEKGEDPVTDPGARQGCDDVTSGMNRIPLIIGIVAVILIVGLVAVIIYLCRKHRSASVMSPNMSNTHQSDGMSNPLYANSEAASEKDIDPASEEYDVQVHVHNTKSVTLTTEM